MDAALRGALRALLPAPSDGLRSPFLSALTPVAVHDDGDPPVGAACDGTSADSLKPPASAAGATPAWLAVVGSGRAGAVALLTQRVATPRSASGCLDSDNDVRTTLLRELAPRDPLIAVAALPLACSAEQHAAVALLVTGTSLAALVLRAADGSSGTNGTGGPAHRLEPILQWRLPPEAGDARLVGPLAVAPDGTIAVGAVRGAPASGDASYSSVALGATHVLLLENEVADAAAGNACAGGSGRAALPPPPLRATWLPFPPAAAPTADGGSNELPPTRLVSLAWRSPPSAVSAAALGARRHGRAEEADGARGAAPLPIGTGISASSASCSVEPRLLVAASEAGAVAVWREADAWEALGAAPRWRLALTWSARTSDATARIGAAFPPDVAQDAAAPSEIQLEAASWIARRVEHDRLHWAWDAALAGARAGGAAGGAPARAAPLGALPPPTLALRIDHGAADNIDGKVASASDLAQGSAPAPLVPLPPAVRAALRASEARAEAALSAEEASLSPPPRLAQGASSPEQAALRWPAAPQRYSGGASGGAPPAVTPAAARLLAESPLLAARPHAE
jgi:hypothetical protein